MWLWRSWVRAPPLTPFSSKPLGLSLGCRQEVKARDFDSRTVGSNPATPARFDPLAQSVEHLTFNQGVRSSNLRRVTKASKVRFAGVAELADAPDLGSGAAGCMSSSLFARTTLRLILICGNSSFGRAPPCQGGGGGFEPRFPLQPFGVAAKDAGIV